MTGITSLFSLFPYSRLVNSVQRSNELYDLLAPEVREELARYEEAKTVPAATALIRRGVPPEHLVILDAGSVEVSFQTGKGLLSTVVNGGGKVFGLREALSHMASEADIVALNQCQVKLIPQRRFTAILKQHPEIYAALARLLSADLKVAQDLLRRAPRKSSSAKPK